VGSAVVRIVQRGDNRIAAGAGGHGCRSIVGDRDLAQTGGAGRDRDGLGRSVVGLGQVAEGDCRRSLGDGQRAGGVGSGVVRIVQRGHNGVAADVGGHGCRSVGGEGRGVGTGGAGRGGGGRGRCVGGLREGAAGDWGRTLGGAQRAGGR